MTQGQEPQGTPTPPPADPSPPSEDSPAPPPPRAWSLTVDLDGNTIDDQSDTPGILIDLKGELLECQ